MPLTSNIPAALTESIHNVLQSDDRLRFACRADMTPDGDIGEGMLAVTTRHLIAAFREKSAWSIYQTVALSDISEIKIEPMVGANALLVAVNGKTLRLFRFSYACAEDMSEAVESLVHLIGREHAPEDHEIIDDKPAPDWSSRAAHLKTFRRLWSFCRPHKRSLALAVLVTISADWHGRLYPRDDDRDYENIRGDRQSRRRIRTC